MALDKSIRITWWLRGNHIFSLVCVLTINVVPLDSCQRNVQDSCPTIVQNSCPTNVPENVCSIDGIDIQDGEAAVASDCSRRCYCDDGQLSCDDNYQCSPNAFCEERNNVRQCYCNTGYEGNGTTCSSILFKDCLDVFNSGRTMSGIYSIEPDLWDGEAFDVYCNMTDGGGWTVFQRRINGYVDFQRNWNVYKDGFGFLEYEHWLGNDKLFSLTNSRQYELRIDLVDSVGNPYFAKYGLFRIAGETDNYAITVESYIDGDAGDSLTVYHNGEDFSTIDRDNDDMVESHLASTTAGPWWYGSQARSSLNANYDSGIIRWLSLPDFHGRIRFAEMKVRSV